MIHCAVAWNPLALDELAEIWLRATDRDAISYATHEIDQELGSDALLKGEDLHEGLRVIRVAPLKVIFFVRQDDRFVEITSVRGE